MKFLLASFVCTMMTVVTQATTRPPYIGVATSAYQIEGAWNQSCKGPSIWDTFTHSTPSNIKDGSTGDVACDHYHHVTRDIQLLADLRVTHYRFSFSWPRILPSGRGEVCADGVRFYSQLLTELEAHNITPVATIFHWDLPQALENEYNGWLDARIVQDFTEYSRFLFRTFGHRISSWITLNEPYTYCVNGYTNGIFAPGIHEPTMAPYQCAHNMLLAHGSVYRVYHGEYHATQHGRISLALNSDWIFPLRHNNDADQRAAQRALEFRLAWFSDPILVGEYPQSMQRRWGDARRLSFTPAQVAMLNQSLDFFALNHYTSLVATHHPNAAYDIANDAEVVFSSPHYRARADSPWLYEVPEGIDHMITWLSRRYPSFFKDHSLIITENGVSMHNAYDRTEDAFRIRFLSAYMEEAQRSARRNNVSLTHYFIWSFMDNFEWASGYTERFGLIHIDFNDPLRPRTWKMSAHWVSTMMTAA